MKPRTLAIPLIAVLTYASFLAAAQGAATQDESRPNERPPSDGPSWRHDGDREGDSRFGRWDRSWPREFVLDREQREVIIDVIHDLRPLTDQDRERLLAMPEDDLRKVLTEGGGRILYLARLRQINRELYDLKILEVRIGYELMRLVSEYRRLKGEESAEAEVVREELREKVREQYEIRLATRELEITQLERRVAEMRAKLADEQSQTDEIIDVWMQNMENGSHDEPPGAGYQRGPDAHRDGPPQADRDHDRW